MVSEEIRRVQRRPQISVVTGAEIVAAEGERGDFRVRLSEGGMLSASSIVLATGFATYDARDQPLLGYGRFPGVSTIVDLDEGLRRDDLSHFYPASEGKLRLAFIQCVGSRDRTSDHEYCSQFCCRATIRLVRRLQYLRPDMEATVFYIDLQIMSKEFVSFFEETREFVRFVQGVPAEITPGKEESTLCVYSVLPGAAKTEALEFDRVVLATGMAPTSAAQGLTDVFHVTPNALGFLAVGGSIETSRDGITAVGACSGPADIQRSRRQAMAAAHRVATQLGLGIASLGVAETVPSTVSTPSVEGLR